jgi:hypothetical protein
MIARDTKTVDALEGELDGVARLTGTRRRAAFERMLSEYRPLPESERTIESHIQYNRLWQQQIARDPAGYDRQTALHDAVVERQTITDVLAAPDEAAFRKAVAGIAGIDRGAPRDVLERDLRAREKTLAEKIHAATDDIVPPSFLRGEHPTPHLWIVKVPFYTDIDDDAFLQAWQRGVERVWQVRDGEDEFRVEIVLTHVSPESLYGDGGVRPTKGDMIDLQAHVARFPQGGAVLTTGANMTRVTAGRCVALGPQDIAPHVLAHELGHILGFKDLYFRGYRDLGADGYEVMEVVAEPDDIMGAPGVGPVSRHHFDALLRGGAWRMPVQPDGQSWPSPPDILR